MCKSQDGSYLWWERRYIVSEQRSLGYQSCCVSWFGWLLHQYVHFIGIHQAFHLWFVQFTGCIFFKLSKNNKIKSATKLKLNNFPIVKWLRAFSPWHFICQHRKGLHAKSWEEKHDPITWKFLYMSFIFSI